MTPLRIFAGAAALLALSACAAQTPPVRPQPPSIIADAQDVLGKDARGLTALFGQPRLDVREGIGRKLQFVNDRCVLDTYLYAPRAGSDAVVTHIDARNRVGIDMAPAACIALLRAQAQ